MQIPSIPPPIITNTLPQDVTAKAVPNVQAMTPLVQNAVDPATKTEKFNQTRSNRDKGKHDPHHDSDQGPEGEDKKDKDGSVNIEV